VDEEKVFVSQIHRKRNNLKYSSLSMPGKPTEPLQTLNGGSTWHRLDLHLHSPNMPLFVLPEETKHEAGKGLIDAYVEQLATQGISIAAITDYNGVDIDWFEVTAAKAINRGITLLPGVEMTLREGKNDLHLLTIFAGDTPLRDVNAFLQSLDKDSVSPLVDNRGGQRDVDLNTGLIDALKALRNRFSCLLVVPYSDQAKGLKGLTAEVVTRFLLEIQPDAIEGCPEEERERLRSKGDLPANFWNRVAFVEFSNPKRIEEIGTQCRIDGTLRSTYVKLSATSIDALRLALHDPETRLSIGGVPSSSHPKIRNLAISGSGFLGNLYISLNQDLNVLIGGRNVGKSAILESLRYALAMTPYRDRSYRAELVHHALGNGGSVEVIVERPIRGEGIRQYRIVRVWGEQPCAFQISPEAPISIGPSELLSLGGGPIIFGQREIFSVLRNEESRLAFLDELIGEEARRCADALGKAMESLTANARAIVEMQAKAAKREEHCQQLRKIEHEIEVHERQVAERRKELAELRSVGECLQNATHSVRSKLEDYDQWRLTLLASLQTAHRNFQEAQSQQHSIHQEGTTILAILQESLKVVLDDERTLFEQALQSLSRLDGRCQEKLRPLEEESRRVERNTQNGPGGQDRLLRLTEEKASLTSRVVELDKCEDHLKTLRRERQGLLRQVKDCRSLQNRLRREKADTLAESLRGRLDLRIEFGGQKESYKGQLSLFLEDSKLSHDAIDRLVIPEATDGIALAEAVRAGSKAVQVRFGLTPEMADRLTRWLTFQESRLFEMETLVPQDAFRFKLRIGGQFQPLERLSVSQGATALLFLLLGLENRILVIDQPEDYLDDRFMREDMVQIMREQKKLKDQRPGRQVILATHDATLPVMGDADLVVSLETRYDHTCAVGQASIDDRSMREIIENSMQRGKEAFQRRADKYGS
jgi:chromosome segregation protein